MSRIVYPNSATEVKYKQNDERSCHFGISEYAFEAIDGFYEEEPVSSMIKESPQFFSSIKQLRMSSYRDLMLSHQYVQIEGEVQMKYDIKEWETESKYDPTRHVINFVTIIQPEYVYINIVHASFNAGFGFLSVNVLKTLPLTTTPLNTIYGNENTMISINHVLGFSRQ